MSNNIDPHKFKGPRIGWQFHINSKQDKKQVHRVSTPSISIREKGGSVEAYRKIDNLDSLANTFDLYFFLK